jgi:hypothetical protein
MMQSGLAVLIASSRSHARPTASANATKTGALPDVAKTAIDDATDEVLKRMRPWVIAGIATTIIGTGISVWLFTRNR